MPGPGPRDQRMWSIGGKFDDRAPGARDRDRILYSSAFRRLAGVTQVITPDDSFIVHNRLTHSLKVAQVGRRIAETLTRKSARLAEEYGGINPDVVEAAGLAHDLGHPPFGHIAEKELDRLACAKDNPDGFEGNAQSFRVLTRLAVRQQVDGLNLTRATLNAVLKYPWYRDPHDTLKNRKWGAYKNDKKAFEFARDGAPAELKSVEAEIMDWADDITYALHDVEDFFRAGLIPLDRLQGSGDELRRFSDEVFERTNVTKASRRDELRAAFINALRDFAPREPFGGTPQHRRILRNFISQGVTRYSHAISLAEKRKPQARYVTIDKTMADEVLMLKQLTWHYVIRNPALAAQQQGQRTIIQTLFKILCKAAEAPENDPRRDILPFSTRESLQRVRKDKRVNLPLERTRLVVDLIAGMSDVQAIRTYQKLTGITVGSVLDQSLHQSISV